MRQRLRARPAPTTSLIQLARHRPIPITYRALIDHATVVLRDPTSTSALFLDVSLRWLEGVAARAGGPRAGRGRASDQRLEAPAGKLDSTLPGLFAGDPPAEFVPILEEIAAAVRQASLSTQLFVMAEADQRDLLSRIAVPTLLIWGELDARSPLSVARQFEQAIPDTRLVVIPGCGHVSNLERPRQFNQAVREFCRAHPPRST